MDTIEIQGVRAKVARTFFQRAKGLIGTRYLERGEGLLILRCNSIHTFFMSFPIDAVFLDRNDKVVKIVRNIRPWRLFVWGGFRAVKVLEVQSRPENFTH
jgi:uncharacterized membrane protein (UPF0127 family)